MVGVVAVLDGCLFEEASIVKPAPPPGGWDLPDGLGAGVDRGDASAPAAGKPDGLAGVEWLASGEFTGFVGHGR
ncbi:MAG TPA: hypothetical protein DCP73_12055 [Chloroflexi bacterium]|nr:hypothetical protein [Chloroflexota bacterium]